MPSAGIDRQIMIRKGTLFFLITIFFLNISAENSVSAGSFVSFFDRSDNYSPTFLYFKADSINIFAKDFILSADAEFLYGFPSKDGMDMLFTNYFNGSTRFLAGYEYKKKLFIGSVTNLSFFSDDDNSSAFITQGFSNTLMKRRSYITEEIVVHGSFLDSKLKFSGEFGYKYQEFSKLTDFFNNTLDGTFQDHDIFSSLGLSYSFFDLLTPFAKVRLSHDLNDDKTYNLSDVRAGLGGNYRFDQKFKLGYQLYYRRLDSDIISENDRLVINSRMIANLSAGFDLFFDGYLEYSFNEGDAFFVNRNFSFAARYWVVENKFNLSLGTSVVFDSWDGSLFVKVWPYLQSELFIFKGGSVFKNFRGFAKFLIKTGENGEYKIPSFMVNSGFSSLIGIVEPAAFFRWNSAESGNIRTMGIDLSLSVRF